MRFAHNVVNARFLQIGSLCLGQMAKMLLSVVVGQCVWWQKKLHKANFCKATVLLSNFRFVFVAVVALLNYRKIRR